MGIVPTLDPKGRHLPRPQAVRPSFAPFGDAPRGRESRWRAVASLLIKIVLT